MKNDSSLTFMLQIYENILKKRIYRQKKKKKSIDKLKHYNKCMIIPFWFKEINNVYSSMNRKLSTFSNLARSLGIMERRIRRRIKQSIS